MWRVKSRTSYARKQPTSSRDLPDGQRSQGEPLRLGASFYGREKIRSSLLWGGNREKRKLSRIEGGGQTRRLLAQRPTAFPIKCFKGGGSRGFERGGGGCGGGLCLGGGGGGGGLVWL